MGLLNNFILSSGGNDRTHNQERDIIDNLQKILRVRRTLDGTQAPGLEDFCESSTNPKLAISQCRDIANQIQQHEPRLLQLDVSLARYNNQTPTFKVEGSINNGQSHKNIFTPIVFYVFLHTVSNQA